MMTPTAGKKVGEITVTALAVNLAAIPLTIVMAGAMVVVAKSLPHSVPDGSLDLLWILPGILVLFSLHELTHALSLVVRFHFPWRSFSFGFSWRLLVFYCHCREPMRLDMYRTFALAPLLTIGSLTVLATLAYPAVWLAILTGIHLAGCIGDVWLLSKLRRFPKHYLLVDLPDRIGGVVHEPAGGVLPSPSQAI